MSLLLLLSSSSSSLVTDLFFLVLPLNQWWSPPLSLPVLHCSTFHTMCDVPSVAVLCTESTGRFPGMASKCFLKSFCYIIIIIIIIGRFGPLQCHALPDLLPPTICLSVPYLDQFFGTLPSDRTSILLRLAGAAAKVRLDSHHTYAHGLGKGWSRSVVSALVIQRIASYLTDCWLEPDWPSCVNRSQVTGCRLLDSFPS